jgi:hypothetical protein
VLRRTDALLRRLRQAFADGKGPRFGAALFHVVVEFRLM